MKGAPYEQLVPGIVFRIEYQLFCIIHAVFSLIKYMTVVSSMKQFLAVVDRDYSKLELHAATFWNEKLFLEFGVLTFM